MGNSPTDTTLTHLCKGISHVQRQRTISCCHHLVKIQYEHTLEYTNGRTIPPLSTWISICFLRSNIKMAHFANYQRRNITSEVAPIIEIFLEFVFPRSLGWSLPQLTVFQTQIVKCKNNSTHYLYRCSSTAGSNAQVCNTPYQYFFILL